MNLAWIEINRAALRHNYSAIQKLVGDAALICVVKANAYGCGAPECARVFAEMGAPMLAVTRVEEALELRDAGIQTPILTLAPALPGEYESAIGAEVTLAIASLSEAMALSELALKMGRAARAQLKVNTGMNRFGAPPDVVAEIIGRGRKLPFLEIGGAFTHLANAAAPDESATRAQWELWKDATFGLENLQMHVANSSALVRFPEMRLDAVRPGTLLYGQFPDGSIGVMGAQNGLQLRDPFSAKARVLALQKVAAGEKFGYGSEWVAPRDSTLAILPVGWADGLLMEPRARPESALEAVKSGLKRAAQLKRRPHGGRMVKIGARSLPIVGRVAMQTCAVDVTDAPEIQVGDEVVVPMRRLAARQGLARIYVEDSEGA